MSNEDFDGFDEIEDSFTLDDVDFDEDFGDDDFLKQNIFVKPKKQKALKQNLIRFQNAHKIVSDFDLSEKQDIFAFLSGNFIFSDLLHGLLTHHNMFVKKMTISTLSFDRYNIGQLLSLIDAGYIEKITIIVSDYFFSHERKKAIQYAYDKLTPTGKFQLAVARVHCKMTIFETERGNKFTIHGSANLRSSDNVEQVHITQNPEIYNFALNLFDKIEREYFTIKKPLKTKTLNTF